MAKGMYKKSNKEHRVDTLEKTLIDLDIKGMHDTLQEAIVHLFMKGINSNKKLENSFGELKSLITFALLPWYKRLWYTLTGKKKSLIKSNCLCTESKTERK